MNLVGKVGKKIKMKKITNNSLWNVYVEPCLWNVYLEPLGMTNKCYYVAAGNYENLETITRNIKFVNDGKLAHRVCDALNHNNVQVI